MPLPQISWDFTKIIMAILVVVIVIAFVIILANVMSGSWSCTMINGMVDKLSMGSGWFRIGPSHVC
jgi:hypothetical protein